MGSTDSDAAGRRRGEGQQRLGQIRALLAEVRTLFQRIKPNLVALTQAIAAQGPEASDDSVLNRDFDEEKQRRFGEEVTRPI